MDQIRERLQPRGIALTDAELAAASTSVHRAVQQANAHLLKRHEVTFAMIRTRTGSRRNPPSTHFDTEFKKYADERKLVAKTREQSRRRPKALLRHAGLEDVSQLRRQHVLAYKEMLIGRNHTAKTINEGHLAAFRSFFNFLVEADKLEDNPAASIRIKTNKLKLGTARSRYRPSRDARKSLSSCEGPTGGKALGALAMRIFRRTGERNHADAGRRHHLPQR